MLPLGSTLRLIVFWFVVFLVQAIVFFLVNIPFFSGTFSDVILGIYNALYMNLATATALSVLAIFLTIIVQFTSVSVVKINRISKIITFTLLGMSCLLLATDLSLYKAWGSKINHQAISYLRYPKEVMPTVFDLQNVKYILIGIALYLLCIWLYKKMKIEIIRGENEKKYIVKIALSILLLGGCLVIVRGGVKAVVLNRNWVFHSKHSLMNYTALNSVWNFIDLVTQPGNQKQNPYVFFTPEKAHSLVEKMHSNTKDSSILFLNSSKPNVVIIMLESWAADVIGALGGEKNVAPKFDELTKEGILFENFYSTGTRTEQGLLAVLSAIPAQPTGSVMHHFGKFDRLPNLFKVFNNQKYVTSYFYGGRLSFDNVEAYLRSTGVEYVYGEDQMQIKKRTAWGAYDEEIFATHLQELHKWNKPFFSVLSTLTTHEWFDAKVPKYFTADPDPVNDAYRNTMHYSDSCLADYLEKAKKESWYKNTVFILVADHSCKFPKHHENYANRRFQIPMLIIGGAVKPEFKNKRISTVASHVDIAAIILKQMGLNTEEFPRSKNVFNPYENAFAYYAFDNGIGLVYADNGIIYDHNQKKIIHKAGEGNVNELYDFGRAYLQYNYKENMQFGEAKKIKRN